MKILLRKYLLFFVLMFPVNCLAKIIYVPQNYVSIQEALNTASEGDTVQLEPGIYFENIIWPEKNGIKLIGNGQNNTFIDGNKQGSVIRFNNDWGGFINKSTVIQDCTIRNGEVVGDDEKGYGGGIYSYNASPSLINVTVSDNRALEGGGLYLDKSSLYLSNVVIQDNLADLYGGGIVCVYEIKQSIFSNVKIVGNTAKEYGGGLYCEEASPKISNSVINGNSTLNCGGGVYCEDFSSPNFSNVVISENNAQVCGGGVFMENQSNPCFSNVTFHKNSAVYSGGGLFCENNSKPNFINGTISNNSSGKNGGGLIFIDSNPTLSNIAIFKNTANEFGGGIFLQHSTPIFDKENRSSIYLNNALTGKDIYSISNSKIEIFLNTFSEKFHSGHYASPFEKYIFDIKQNLINVPQDYSTIQQALNNVLKGGVIEVAAGTYYENLQWPEVDGIKLIGSEKELTIIDGQKKGRVIHFKSEINNIDSETLIQSLHITNGKADFGGGIFCEKANPTLLNIIITGNLANKDGGGIACYDAKPILSKVVITDNTATNKGGGLFCDLISKPVFDSENRCDIYSNNASSGKDIYSENQIDVALYYFSEKNPTSIYASPIDNFSFDIQFGKLVQTVSDLYVSPTGSNLNSGTHKNSPLKTISYALTLIADASNEHKKIFLDEGTYSTESNGETFPLNIVGSISIIGEKRNTTIIEGNGRSSVLHIENTNNANIEGITIKKGKSIYGGGIYCNDASPKLSNVIITDNYANFGGGIHCKRSNPTLTNVIIHANTALSGGGLFCNQSNPILTSVVITNNSAEDGGGLYCDSRSMPSFDTENLCDIYFNHARTGKDLFSHNFLKINANMFTVLKPSEYYAFPITNFMFNIHQGKLPQYHSTLYVSPNGSNLNSGATSSKPLKTIDYALSIIISNSNQKGLIILDEGIYSANSNEEKFPLHLFNYIRINGAGYNKTILDGNNEKRILNFYKTNDVIISDLTIQNGKDDKGGGINCYYSSPAFFDVHITNNSAFSRGGGVYCYYSHPLFSNVSINKNISLSQGGGIFCYRSNPKFSNVAITENSAHYGGGGIFCFSKSYPVFDIENLCDIYYNDARTGKDIYSENQLHISANYFTVLHPTDLYVSPIDNITFQIEKGKLVQSKSNLYVSPTGNNSNTGISPDLPLKTLGYALSIIAADQNNQNVIFLDEGEYSKKSNDETFPLNLFSYISIKGQGKNQSILDGNHNSRILNIEDAHDILIEGLTIKNGKDDEGGGIYCRNSSPQFINIIISDSSAEMKGGGIYCYDASPYYFNVSIFGNIAKEYGGGIYCDSSSQIISNSILSNNTANNGGGFFSFRTESKVMNSTIRNNTANQDGGGMTFGSGSNAQMNNTLIISNSASRNGGGINCYAATLLCKNITVGANSVQSLGGGVYTQGGNISLVNAIFYYNSPHPIYINPLNSIQYDDLLSVEYSNIENGLEGILYSDENYEIHWGDGNISTNPLFVDSYGDYYLQMISPCINAGDPDFDNDGLSFETDLDDQDPDGTRMDMGALSFPFVLSLDIPQIIKEDAGTIADQALVSIDNIQDNDVVVNLYSDNSSLLSIPGTVIIPAGNISTCFDISIADNDICNEPKSVRITATSPNWRMTYRDVIIQDNDLTVKISSPEHNSSIDNNLMFVQGEAFDRFESISKIELTISNTIHAYTFSKNILSQGPVSWSFNVDEIHWKTDSLYTVSATVYNTAGYSNASFIHYGMIDSSISCEISENEIIVGKPIIVSGGITPIPPKSAIPINIELHFVEQDNLLYPDPAFTNQKGEFTFQIDCRYLDKAGTWNIKTNWSGESFLKSAESNSQQLNVTKSSSRLTLAVSSRNVKMNEKITIGGKLSSQTDCDKGLLEQDLAIKIIDPKGSETLYPVKTENIFGHYQLKDFSEFNQLGKWKVQASFSRTNSFLPSISETLEINVVESAGYAIIVQGKIKDGEGLRSHNKTTQFVYHQLKQRGFVVDETSKETQLSDDIYYLNHYVDQTGVDAIPTYSKVEFAITTWAKNKLNTNPSNLYIIMIDHGLDDQFFVYQENGEDSITSQDLRKWLDQLQSDLINSDAQNQEIVLILGFCYSGSFIHELSGDNRIIITSASENELSYKGPKEIDDSGNIFRDGEYFVTELFKKIALGNSLTQAFQQAVQLTEQYTMKASGVPNAPYFDHSLQHPLLDDNGDGIGSNDISDPSGDGQKSNSIYLGVSERTANDPDDVTIEQVADSIYLLSDQNSTDKLWARVFPNNRLRTMWIEIKQPDYKTDHLVNSGQKEMDLIKIPYTPSNYNLSNDCYEWLDVNEFSTPGMYQVFYFAMDDLTGNISSLMETRVYKARHENLIPEPFNLISPKYIPGSQKPSVKTSLILDWEKATGPDNNQISYTILISKNRNFLIPSIKKENLNHSTCLINRFDGLENFTTYYWQVLAIDLYGGIQKSDIWEFYTDDPDNPVWGAIEANVYDGITGNPVDNAEIRLGNLSTLNKTENGYFLDLVPPDANYRVSIRAQGYAETIFENIEIPEMETVAKTFKLLPSSMLPGDMNVNGRIDLGDVVLGLQFLSKFDSIITIPKQVDCDDDGIIGLSDVIYVMQCLLKSSIQK